MSCCGSKREELRQSLSLPVNVQQEPDETLKMWDDITFEFTGTGALSVRGNVTGIHYLFNGTGVKVLVDYRDVSGMRGEPLLKRIRQ
jgi:hypothetical protein